MKKSHQFTTTEIAMRALRFADPLIRRPDFLMGDVADRMAAELELSRSQSYRLLRTVLDVCGVHYESNYVRNGRMNDKRAESAMFNRSNPRRPAA